MKGIVVTLLHEIVAEARGERAWDAVLDRAGSDGAYTAVGSYPDDEFARLVGAVAEVTARTRDEVLVWLGCASIPRLARRYPHVFEGHRSAHSFVLTLNDIIHPEVRKLLADAHAPSFEFDTSQPGRLALAYHSSRNLCRFAEGLLRGAAAHFGELATVTHERCTRDGDPACVLACFFRATLPSGPATPPAPPEAEATTRELATRLDRERLARYAAEAIAERTTAELYASNRELRALNRALQEVVAVASHELRAPLTTLVGFAELLDRRWDRTPEARRRELVAAIVRSAGHLERLVEDLLTVSRIGIGALEARAEVVRVRTAVEEAAAALGDDAQQVRIAVDGDIAVLADPDHVRRILLNCLMNALRYGAPPVDLEARRDDGWVVIRVRDHGAGIPPEFVPRLFEPFAQVVGPDERGEGGTGLGLSIVRGLARANDGDVWYEPDAAPGACFAVRLPAADPVAG